MATPPWMIYGAYGYTGRLVAAEAVRRGHRPLLAGRDGARLRELGVRLGLDWRAFALDDHAAVERGLTGVDVVLNTAGPFDSTSRPLLEAAIVLGTSYADISGELDVYEAIFARAEEIRRAGIAVVLGVGFDVVPTDCLAVRAARELGGAESLEIAVGTTGGASGGTLRATVRMAGLGGRTRRDGELAPEPVGSRTLSIHLPAGDRGMISAPLGDLASAYRSAGAPTISTFLIVPPGLRAVASAGARIGAWLATIQPIQKGVDALIRRFVDGPDAEALATSRTESWVRAVNGGASVEFMLDAPGGYTYSRASAVSAVEHLVVARRPGVMTPAQAFGEAFIDEIPSSVLWRRRDGGAWQKVPLAS